MRQVVVDTETTGLNPSSGDRIVEIACVELIDSRLSGREFHSYLNPGIPVPSAALAVHGLTDTFLSDKPGFKVVADTFLQFVAGAELVIHNAPFDLGFLNAELARGDRLDIHHHCPKIIDTLLLARQVRPRQRNDLDSLSFALGISKSRRELHGALADARLTARVFLAMRQKWTFQAD